MQPVHETTTHEAAKSSFLPTGRSGRKQRKSRKRNLPKSQSSSLNKKQNSSVSPRPETTGSIGRFMTCRCSRRRSKLSFEALIQPCFVDSTNSDNTLIPASQRPATDLAPAHILQPGVCYSGLCCRIKFISVTTPPKSVLSRSTPSSSANPRSDQSRVLRTQSI